MKKSSQALAVSVLMLFGLAASWLAFADDSKAVIDTRVTDALAAFYAANPKHQVLATQAAGMLVFPRITKAGAGVAGEHGDGVLRVHGKTVDYYSIGAASVGLTLGVAQHSEVIMFMTQAALDKFTQSKGWTIGADTGVAVMKTGAGGEYDSKTLQKPILGFAYGEKGLIGDLSLEGSKITKLDK
jgi:lipid-binding SYLF domain-containing protein